MAFTKADLIDSIHHKLGLNKREAKDLVECVFEVIRQALEQGENVKISRVGNFILHDKRARPGRNPKTGEFIAVTERRVVTFKAGQKLRSRIEEYGGTITETSHSQD